MLHLCKYYKLQWLQYEINWQLFNNICFPNQQLLFTKMLILWCTTWVITPYNQEPVFSARQENKFKKMKKTIIICLLNTTANRLTNKTTIIPPTMLNKENNLQCYLEKKNWTLLLRQPNLSRTNMPGEFYRWKRGVVSCVRD